MGADSIDLNPPPEGRHGADAACHGPMTARSASVGTVATRIAPAAPRTPVVRVLRFHLGPAHEARDRQVARWNCGREFR
jgi:hypothetical protein